MRGFPGVPVPVIVSAVAPFVSVYTPLPLLEIVFPFESIIELPVTPLLLL